MENKDYVVSGVVSTVEATQTFGDKGFQKRLVVLEQDNGKFKNYIPVEFVNDACQAVDDIQVGSTIQVRFFLNGRKWQKDPQSEVRYFVAIRAADYRVLEQTATVSQETSQEVQYKDEDLPF